MFGKPLTARQIGEFEARDFLGEETWKRWKMDYDHCMGYRKTIKGKPTEEQRVILEANAQWIEFYGSVLFHSVSLAKQSLCACTRCGQKRQGAKS
jgi:hypothetical protein